MKAENINPFIQSISEVFESMLDSKVAVKDLHLSAADEGHPDIIGLIGLSGTAKGIVALKLPVPTALAIIGKMVGTGFKSVDSSVIDGVGELVNIIAGNAKAKFEGQSISLSLPTVVRGSIYRLQNLGEMVWLSLPFESELGEFSLEVSFKQMSTTKQEVAHASACGR